MSVVAHSVQFDRICRTCLLVEQNMKSVFDTDCSLGEAHLLFEMLMACTSVQVSEGDGLPTQICLSCINQIARSFTFKKLCEDSDSTLRGVLRKSTIMDNQCFTERQPFSSDVALHSEEALTDIDPDVLDIKVKFEEGATHIGGLPSKSCFIDGKSLRDYRVIHSRWPIRSIRRTKRVSDTVHSKCETMIQAANDPATIQSVHNENTKVYPIPNASHLDPVTIKSVCIEDRKDDLMHEKNDLQNNTLVNKKCMLRSIYETEQPIYPCLDCTACFTDEYDLKIHKDSSHKCDVCNKVYADITRLRNHIVDVHGPKLHCCRECGKGFARIADCARHERVHSDARPFVCQLCNKQFKRSFTLSSHHREVHCNEKKYMCAECGKGFQLLTNFNVHLKKHDYIKTHTCTVCKEKCRDSAALAAHRKIHTKAKNYVCSYCGKGCSTSSELRVHERMHTGVKPYVCNLCNKSFGTKGTLTAHIRSHRGEKPHTCNVCGKGCVNPTKLKIHMRIHTGEKPYQCHLCPKALTRCEDLKRHIQMHTGERNHICSYCNKGFYTVSTLKEHVNIHTGEKPYTCKFCNKSFAASGTLCRHLKQH